MTFESLLKDYCDIKVPIETQNSFGEIENTYSANYVNIACRVVPNSQPPTLNNIAIYQEYDYVFYFKPEQIVSSGYQLLFESNNYDVVKADLDSSKHHLKVLTKRVK